MKIFLTILFFADTFLLAGLSYGLFRAIDHADSRWALWILPVAMAASIYGLAYLLRRYMQLRSNKR